MLVLQGPRENRDHKEGQAFLARMVRMEIQENEANQEKRGRRDLQELVFRAPEDLQDLLVPKDRADLATRVQRDALEILELLVGQESLDQWGPQDLRDTVTRTLVWATMLESNSHPASSKTTERPKRMTRTATTNPTTRLLNPCHLMTPRWRRTTWS